MDDIKYLYGSNGSGEAPRLTITSARAPGATTFEVDSVTNVPAHFVGTTGTLNPSTGLIDPATVKVFKGSLDGSDIQLDEWAPGYTDPTGSQVGQVIVIKPATIWADIIASALGAVAEIVAADGSFTPAALEVISESRRAPRIAVDTSAGTLTPDIDDFNYYRMTALAVNITINNPTGTPADGDGLLIELTGTAPRTITWDSDYEANSEYGLSLPSTTITTKTTMRTFVWSAARSKWLMVG